VLYAEAARRSLAGQPRAETCAWLGGAATAAFDLLEPPWAATESVPADADPAWRTAVVQLTRRIRAANSARPEYQAAHTLRFADPAAGFS
jgi:hypothetical protein